MKKILALMMILMMLSALTLTSGAANTKQEEPPVNFDAVVKEFYKEGEEVTVPGKAPVGESIVYVEPSAVEDMMNVKITEWPSPYLIRVIDEQGEPVPNVNISVLLPSIANPAYAYHLEKSYGISNQEGFVILWLPASYRMTVGMWNSGDKIEKQLVDFDDLEQIDGCYQLVWEHPTLEQLAEEADEGVQIQVVNEEGDTVSGLEVRAEEKDGTNGGFSGYTQKDGMFYSLREQDGSELDLTLTGKRGEDGKQITRHYTISPEAGKMNCYKINWVWWS